MSRPKKVTDSEILDAIERVVVKLGASHLSIDAVAQEAGISKSRVVYDYKSKTALLEALIDRQFERDTARIKSLLVECADTPHPELFARIKIAERALDSTERAVAMAITSLMSSEESLRQRMLRLIERDLLAMDSGAKPEAARMAYFALIGFSCHEWFGLVQRSDDERLPFLEQIRKMYVGYHESHPDNQTKPIKRISYQS
ncbi:MAG TPA: TetR/AcrR family transcriptional regulator [Chlorobaculum sp.]|jgi:AcrR family transcriptional regulator|nr:TetR/AcrR family transcriptional regulator [Chlorobaculum sp.]